jgi:hypothetical protein
MKKLLFLILISYSLTANAQIFVHAGTSPIKGSIGLELQPIKHLSVSGGYRFTRVWSAGNIHSWSGSLNYYFRIEPALLYVSCGVASKGIVAQDEFHFWSKPVPAEYLMVGTRYYPHEAAKRFPDRCSFDIGIGASMSNYTNPELVIDFEINWKLFKFE